MYTTRHSLSKNDINYNSIVEDTRKSRCESAIENIKKRLTYINQKFIDELYQNTFFPDNARIIMKGYDSFARINEFFDNNRINFSYFYDCNERERLRILSYFQLYFYDSNYVRRYYEYKQNIITSDMHPLVVDACDVLYSIITSKIEYILTPLRALKGQIEEEEYVQYHHRS